MTDIEKISAYLRGGSTGVLHLDVGNLVSADLHKANLTDAILTDANLSNADLRKANIIRTDLFKAKNLREAKNLNKEHLIEANLTEIIRPDF